MKNLITVWLSGCVLGRRGGGWGYGMKGVFEDSSRVGAATDWVEAMLDAMSDEEEWRGDRKAAEEKLALEGLTVEGLQFDGLPPHHPYPYQPVHLRPAFRDTRLGGNHHCHYSLIAPFGMLSPRTFQPPSPGEPHFYVTRVTQRSGRLGHHAVVQGSWFRME